MKRISNSIISRLANLNPYLCDRVWCYWVGGFDLIEGEFIRYECELRKSIKDRKSFLEDYFKSLILSTSQI